MLSILLLSQKGEGYETIDRLIKEDNYVKYWVEDTQKLFDQSQGTKVNRYDQHIETSDIVISLNPRYGRICEEVRRGGRMALGGDLQGFLVDNEVYRANVLKFLDIHDEEVVDQPFSTILCGWFNGNQWLSTYVVQHYNRLLDGDRGPAVGNMGYVALREDSRINELAEMLRIANYRGFFGVEVFLVGDQLYLDHLITTPCEGLIAAIQEISGTSLTNLIFAVASGKQLPSCSSKSYGISVGLRQLGIDRKLNDLETPAKKHFWPSCDSLIQGYVSAKGESIREARRRVYRTVANITTIDTVYRKDIGVNSIWDWKEGANAAVPGKE